MLASSPQINHYAPASKGADVRITFGILVPLLMAFTTSVVHHWLLLRIEGRPVIAYSQFWIKNVDNALATIVVLLLGLSLSTSLTQVVRSSQPSHLIVEPIIGLADPMYKSNKTSNNK